MKLTKESYMKFEMDWFHGKLPNVSRQRLGQAVCNNFELPKEIEDKIFYEVETSKVQVILWSSFDTVSGELTPEQIQRQDFVDTAINGMIYEVLRYRGEDLEWDTSDVVKEIRELIRFHYIESQDEMDFYPYLEE